MSVEGSRSEIVQHTELLEVIFASVAVIKGVPRERYKAWAAAEGIPGSNAEDTLDVYDWVENMVEVDFRLVEDGAE